MKLRAGKSLCHLQKRDKAFYGLRRGLRGALAKNIGGKAFGNPVSKKLAAHCPGDKNKAVSVYQCPDTTQMRNHAVYCFGIVLYNNAMKRTGRFRVILYEQFYIIFRRRSLIGILLDRGFA
jgi:hypothetical protein